VNIVPMRYKAELISGVSVLVLPVSVLNGVKRQGLMVHILFCGVENSQSG
jgi:hypothetical protein